VASALVLGVVSLDTVYPPSRSYTRKFLQLSYPTHTDTDDKYRQGPDDLYFVLAWVVIFTALRAVSIEWILQPLAESFGVAQQNRLRLAEQGWLVLYYVTFWGLGMVCYPHSAAHGEDDH
jgi:very-long-chain ceramide synthase